MPVTAAFGEDLGIKYNQNCQWEDFDFFVWFYRTPTQFMSVLQSQTDVTNFKAISKLKRCKNSLKPKVEIPGP